MFVGSTEQIISPGNIGFKTDIIDNGGEFVLKADLPGFKKEDIVLLFCGRIIQVKGAKETASGND